MIISGNIQPFSPELDLDSLQTQRAVTMYYDQMKPLMDKYAVTYHRQESINLSGQPDIARKER